MTTIPLQTLLAVIPSRVIAVLRDREHSAADLVRHLAYCYAWLPTTPRNIQFDAADQNRLCGEFCRDYCAEDGAVNWEKLLALNVGTGVEAGDELETIPAERCQDCNAELSQCGPQDSDGEPTMDCKECQLRNALHESQAGAAALREALEDFKVECRDCGGVGWYAVGQDAPEQVQCQRCHGVQFALSTNAGRELLAEFREACEHREFLREELAKSKAEVNELAFHLSPEKEAELRDEVERLQDDALGWKFAALQARFCKADIDVSTPAKYLTAEADAKCNILNELERLRFGCNQVAIVAAERDSAREQLATLQRKVNAAEGLETALKFFLGDGDIEEEVKTARAALTAWREAQP